MLKLSKHFVEQTTKSVFAATFQAFGSLRFRIHRVDYLNVEFKDVLKNNYLSFQRDGNKFLTANSLSSEFLIELLEQTSLGHMLFFVIGVL